MAVHANDTGLVPSTRAGLLKRRYLFNRWVDFATLGGGSLVVLAALAAFYPRTDEARITLAVTMYFLAHFVNNPHFAYSYQIFYKGFKQKAFSPKSVLRFQYLTAGITVPAALVIFFAIALAQGNAPLLGLAANALFFTVGWHYAKQGYGILMVDAANKGTRFSPVERRRLLWNTHLTWVTLWLMTNDAVAAKQYWGLIYLMFDVPDAILAGLYLAVALSTALVARDFWMRWRAGRPLPVNGLIGYVCGVYIWLGIARFDIFLSLVTPLFHSLQYLGVVWRYQLNVEAGRRCPPASTVRMLAWLRSAPARLARFMLVGGLLGAAGFWWAPEFLDANAGYDRSVFGATAFLFMGWCFINIHHYFIDNVIWRRENPEARKHLFAPGST